MNRATLASLLAEETGLSTAQAQQALTGLLDGIARTLAEGESVVLPGFGTFEVRQRAARTGRNPQTGEEMQIAATAVPAFKPGKALKDAVAGR